MGHSADADDLALGHPRHLRGLGAAGLVYEIVWSRQLVLVFGNTTQAVSAILAGFFGGMAIGSVVGGRLADRVRSPLRLYGLIELVLVVVVLVTPLTFGVIRSLYGEVAVGLEGAPQLLAVLRLGLALLALAPATVLMGATLPTLTRYLSADAHLSESFGRLYAANTIGAIVGTFGAGLVLIEVLGLRAPCGWVRLFGVRRGHGPDPVPAVGAVRVGADPGSDASVDAVASGRPIGGRAALALTVAFMSGLTSLGYQVLWTRLLASGTGNTTYVFTVILGVFLIGLALGALVFNLVRSRIGDPVRFLAVAQIVVAVLVMVGLVGVLVRPENLDPGKPLATLQALLVSTILVVLPVTIVLGMSFPAASALLADDARHAGSESGSLLAVNTVGAIAASVLIPFLLIPILGSPLVVVLLALLNAAWASPWPCTSGRWRGSSPRSAWSWPWRWPPSRSCPTSSSSRTSRPSRPRVARSSSRPRTRSPRSRPARSRSPPSSGWRARR